MIIQGPPYLTAFVAISDAAVWAGFWFGFRSVLEVELGWKLF
jgi:hypothetical protein